jgi:hypothetical protein
LTWKVPRAWRLRTRLSRPGGRISPRTGRLSSSSTPAEWPRWGEAAGAAGPCPHLAYRCLLRARQQHGRGGLGVPPADTATWAAGSAGSYRPNGLAAAAGSDPRRARCPRHDGQSSRASRVGRVPGPVRSVPCPAVRCRVAGGRNLVHRPSAKRRVADPGRFDLSDAVIRSFERLGWATLVRRPTRLDSCRSASRQPGEIR